MRIKTKVNTIFYLTKMHNGVMVKPLFYWGFQHFNRTSVVFKMKKETFLVLDFQHYLV